MHYSIKAGDMSLDEVYGVDPIDNEADTNAETEKGAWQEGMTTLLSCIDGIPMIPSQCSDTHISHPPAKIHPQKPRARPRSIPSQWLVRSARKA